MSLGDTYCITGYEPSDPEYFLAQVAKVLAQGHRLLQLRSKHFNDDQYQYIAQKTIALAKPYQAKVLLNSDKVKNLNLLGADGIHLTSHALNALKTRPFSNKIVAASCHNLAELHQAEALAVDFVMLSPVLPTRVKPDLATLGWQAFSALANKVSVPVYAGGGLNLSHLAQAKTCGAVGIAAIDAFWLCDDGKALA